MACAPSLLAAFIFVLSPRCQVPRSQHRSLRLNTALLAGREKLIALIPGGHAWRVCDVEAERKSQVRHLLHPREVPCIVILIGWLMVVLGVELLERLLAEVGRLADVVAALGDRECRDPYARE